MLKIHNMLVKTAHWMNVESTKPAQQGRLASLVSGLLCRKNTVDLSSKELVKAIGSKVVTLGVNGVKNNPKKIVAAVVLPAALFGIHNFISNKNYFDLSVDKVKNFICGAPKTEETFPDFALFFSKSLGYLQNLMASAQNLFASTMNTTQNLFASTMNKWIG